MIIDSRTNEILLYIACSDEDLKNLFLMLEQQQQRYLVKGKNQAKLEFKNWLDTREE